MKKQWFVFCSLENPQETKIASPYLDYLTWNTKDVRPQSIKTVSFIIMKW